MLGNVSSKVGECVFADASMAMKSGVLAVETAR